MICDDCIQITSGRCWKHQEQLAVTDAMVALSHIHDWRLAGQLADGSALLVCNQHEPPWTRRVIL